MSFEACGCVGRVCSGPRMKEGEKVCACILWSMVCGGEMSI